MDTGGGACAVGYRVKWSDWRFEDKLLAVIFTVMALLLLWILAGCTNSKKAESLEILWHSDACLLIAQGLSIEEAQNLQRDWDFSECNVEVNESSN